MSQSGTETAHDTVAGIERFLRDQFGGTWTVSNLVPVSAGARRRNVVLDAVTAGEHLRLVATIVPTNIELVPITAEAGIRELARDNGVPVPRIHAVCTDPTYVGASFLLSERVDGETVPRRVLRLVDAEGIGNRIAEQLGVAMGRLHGIDPAVAGFLPGDEHADPASAALAELDSAVDLLLADRPVFAFALRWLERNLPGPPPRRTVVHNDIRNGNRIVGPDGLRAVLDWEGARCWGDPMRDAAWAALRMWRFREDTREIGGFADRSVFVAGYESVGGLFDSDRFHWWKVLCTLWWGVGLASQAAAHLDGSVRDIVMAASGRRVPEIEWDLLMLTKP